MHSFVRMIGLIFFLINLSPPIFADDLPIGTKAVADPRINEKLATLVKEHNVPGIVAGIVQGSDLIAVGAAGLRKVDSTEPITVNDKLHLGSCTKAMTATRIAMLVEQGQLAWDSTLADVFPEEMNDVHPDFHNVTLTQLLTHRSGAPANIFWGLMGNQLSMTEKRRKVLRVSLKNKPAKAPGTAFEYSNVGYVLAGAMAERVTGQTWEQLMQEGLFQPLEMSSAGFGPPGTKETLDQPWGHSSFFGFRIPFQDDNSPELGPAGVVHASIPDWAKFAALHLQGARSNTTQLQPDSFIRLQTPPQDADYAMGWVIESPDWAKSRGLWHNGSNTMWYSLVWIFPEKNVALLVVTNCFDKSAQNACNQAVRQLLEYYETELLKN